MTTKRLAILFLVLLGGFSAVFALPQQLGFQPVGLNLEMPEIFGEWWGQPVEVSQLERDTLGPDTEFSRRFYENGRGDRVLASIVLAGQDMMTSIHRPERCLQAQGWAFEPGGERLITLPGLGNLPVQRLKNRKEVKGPDGKPVMVENICYYWFVGHRDLTSSHLDRVWIDSRDRLMSGMVQRWGMIMINSDITKNHSKFGRDERGTDALLEAFVKELAPKIHKETLAYR
jgi:EpsI family protein